MAVNVADSDALDVRWWICLPARCVFLGSGPECSACEEHLPSDHADAAVHQELLPVGERPAEHHGLPGQYTELVIGQLSLEDLLQGPIELKLEPATL